MIKLQLGFTDISDTENFAHDESFEHETSVRYNILKQDDSIEKAVIEWELDTSITAVQNAIEIWEHTIRRPHLSMVQVDYESNKLLSTHNDVSISLQFVNLIPLNVEPKMFTEEDLNRSVSPANRQFGDLEFSVHSLYDEAGYSFEETAEYALHDDNLDYYNPDAAPLCLPYFRIDFNLAKSSYKKKPKKDIRTVKFLETHRTELEQLGITEEKFLQTYGRLKAGTLITDPLEAYETLKQYKYVCRTSITEQ